MTPQGVMGAWIAGGMVAGIVVGVWTGALFVSIFVGVAAGLAVGAGTGRRDPAKRAEPRQVAKRSERRH